jgi:hypothetical protein
MTKARENSDYTGLQGDLALKSPVASPVFTGNVGIGVTPANPLHVTKEIAGYQAYFNNDNGSAQGLKVRVKANDSGNFNILDLVSASTGSDVSVMTVRDDGIVTKPNQPAFGVRGNTFSGVDFIGPTVFSNVGGHFNTSNGRFTAPVGGVYSFTFNLTTNDALSHFVDLAKNGATVFGHQLIYNITYNTGSMSTAILLAAGDYITAQKRASNYSVYNANFSGHLIG